MQLEALKVFCDVVRFHSFSRGARENDVTQSCASQTVQQLEERLGTPLIERSRRPWRVTQAGREFYEGCRELIERFAEIERRICRYRNASIGLVRVAAIYSVGLGPMNQYIRKFSQLHPDVRIQIEYLHPDQVYRKVLDAEADIGIVSFPRADRRFTVTPWRREPMTVVCTPEHPIARYRRIDLSRISGERFVGLERGLAIRREIDRFLKRRRIRVEVTQEFDNIEAVKRAVEAGFGLSILPMVTLEREVEMGTLRAVPFAGKPLIRPLGIIQRRGAKPRPNVIAFIRLLKSETRDMPAAEGADPRRSGAGVKTNSRRV